MFLFKVAETFRITGRGLALIPDTKYPYTATGSKIKLIHPDKTVLETKIIGIAFVEPCAVLIKDESESAAIPTGTEVWLIEIL